MTATLGSHHWRRELAINFSTVKNSFFSAYVFIKMKKERDGELHALNNTKDNKVYKCVLRMYVSFLDNIVNRYREVMEKCLIAVFTVEGFPSQEWKTEQKMQFVQIMLRSSYFHHQQ
jgi:hypothetical protein